MKIGVWMRYGYSPLTGGGFSYFDAFVSKLKEYQFIFDFIVFFNKVSREGKVD